MTQTQKDLAKLLMPIEGDLILKGEGSCAAINRAFVSGVAGRVQHASDCAVHRDSICDCMDQST